MGPSVPHLAACVVDANVLIKLFLPEDGADVATALMQSLGDPNPAIRAIPDLAYLECANIFWKWVRQGMLSATVVQDSVTDLLALPLQVWPAEYLLERSVAMALAHDIAVYDAAYLALADLLAVPLVTADAALIRKIGGPTAQLRLLSDLDNTGGGGP